MIDTTTVSAIVVAAGVVVGLAFTMMELRHMARARKMEVIMSVYREFGTKEMVEAMYSVGTLKREGNLAQLPPQEALTGAMQVAVAMEGLGVLLDEGLIDIRLVNSLFGPTLDFLWDTMSVTIKMMRESLKEPFFFSHYEKLHERLIEYRKTQH